MSRDIVNQDNLHHLRAPGRIELLKLTRRHIEVGGHPKYSMREITPRVPQPWEFADVKARDTHFTM